MQNVFGGRTGERVSAPSLDASAWSTTGGWGGGRWRNRPVASKIACGGGRDHRLSQASKRPDWSLTLSIEIDIEAPVRRHA